MHGVGERVDLGDGEVADAERTHLSRVLKVVESARDFVRLAERVGAVEEKDVEMVRSQSAETAFNRADEVRVAEVVALRRAGRIVGEANPALRLKHDLFAEFGPVGEDAAEHFLGAPAPVDVGVIEKRDSCVERGVDCYSDIGVVIELAERHAPVSKARGRDVAEQNRFHK